MRYLNVLGKHVKTTQYVQIAAGELDLSSG